MPYYGYGFNLYWFLLVLPAVLLSVWAQYNVQGTYRKYSGRLSMRGLTGAQAARMILDRNGLGSVQVVMVGGRLTDHYDPRTNVVSLSQGVYAGASVASIGVAAHECGHAVQHSVGYFPIRVRSAIIPVTQFGSTFAVPLIIVGMILNWGSLILAGILLFSLAVLFQLVTLPVEFNASARALRTLDEGGILYGEELSGARKVLRAAALTYVAAMLVSLAYLLQYLLMFMGMRRRN